MSITHDVAVESVDPRSRPATRWENPGIVRHRLDGDRYTSVEFFQREWEHVWTKVWLLLGRENAVPQPGSYQIEEVGPESIIIVRQADLSIKAFYNVCQHRGSRLSFSAEGLAQKFTCPYHGWTYALDGTLVHAQDPEDFPQNPCEHIRLVELRCETFLGFVWVNMDPECGPLRDFLGPLWDEWSAYQPEQWRRFTALTVRMPCNWKVLQDNFCESYHLPMVHPQLKDTHEDSYLDTTFDRSAQGHNRMIMKGATPSRAQYGDQAPLPDGLAHRLQLWGLDPAAFHERPFEARQALQRQMRQMGPARGHHHYENLRDDQLTDAHHYNLFPNCSLTFGPDGVLLQRMRPHATDPNQCVFDHWYYAFVGAADDGVLAAQTNVRVDGLECVHEVFDWGDQPMGIIPDQDGAITIGQQLGLRSRGYRGAYPAGQEDRISGFHQLIDEYIAGQRP
jgi:phenylpropionate dioxygenase-like ring-hydroxylating dioxygenase large terminal subunit